MVAHRLEGAWNDAQEMWQLVARNVDTMIVDRIRGAEHSFSHAFKQPKLTLDKLRGYAANLSVAEGMLLPRTAADFSTIDPQRSGAINALVAAEVLGRMHAANFEADPKDGYGRDEGPNFSQDAREFLLSAGFDQVQVFRNSGPAGTYDGVFTVKRLGDKLLVTAMHLGLDGDEGYGDIDGRPTLQHPRGGYVHPAFYHEATYAAGALAEFIREEVATKYPGMEIVTQQIGYSKGGALTPEIDRQLNLALGDEVNGHSVRRVPFIAVNQGPMGDAAWRASIDQEGFNGYAVVVENDWSNALGERVYNRFARSSFNLFGFRPFSYPGSVVRIPKENDNWEEAHSITGVVLNYFTDAARSQLAALRRGRDGEMGQDGIIQGKDAITPLGTEKESAALSTGIIGAQDVPAGMLATEAGGYGPGAIPSLNAAGVQLG